MVHRHSLDKISIKILLSYLSILFLPLCAIVLINVAAVNTILEAQKEKNLYALGQAAKTVDMRLEELRHISTYIGSDNRTSSIVNRSRYSENGKTDIFPLFQLVNAFPNYPLTNQMIDEVYIFFAHADYVAKLPSAFPSSRYNYENLVDFRGISFDEMEQLRVQPHAGRLLIGEDDTGRSFLLLNSFPDARTPQGLVIINIREEAIREILRTNEVGPGGGVYIQDESGRLLTSIGADAPDFSHAEGIGVLRDSGSHEIQVDGKRFIACSLTSGEWTYTSLTSNDYLLRNFVYIRYSIFLLGSGSVLLGALICVVLWRRRHRFYKRVSSYAHSSGLAHSPAKNEHSFLESTVNSFVYEMGSLRTALQQQGALLANSILRNLLHGDFESHDQLQGELESCELDLQAGGYHVVHVDLATAESQLEQGRVPLTYRVHIKRELPGFLLVPHLSCDLDNSSFALILLEEEPISTPELGELFQNISAQLEETDRCSPRFALSGGSGDIAAIPALFSQAVDTQEYMTLLGLAGCLTVEHLPRTDDIFYYPLTEEIRLVQLIKKGDLSELELFLHILQKKNILDRSLPLPMLRELCEALRRNILRALQETSSGPDPDIAQLVHAVEQEASFAGILACARRANRCLNQLLESHSEQERTAMREPLRAIVEEELSNPAFNLYFISQRIGLPENTLYRNFKMYFGVSFSEYLEQRRIERACRLLQKQVSIKDVAAQVGYTSDHTFRRAFKRIVKVLPSQYAEQ